jgi:hypothetical protein
MNYDKSIKVHTIICDQFFFNRKNVEVPAGNFDDELEPGELVYEIFNEVIATNLIQLSETTYGIELLSKNPDLYLTPIIEYFNLQIGDIISKPSAPIVQQVRKRPLEIGSSIAPLNENWWGTLGCFVKDVNNGEDYVLSNHHVLFSDLGYKDNFIAQPAPCHGGGNDDAIGLYVRSLAPDTSGINEFDAAVAGPISAEFSRLIPELNVYANELTNASIGMKVYKIGATTGKTFGVIKSIISSIKVDNANGDVLDYQNQIAINGTTNDFLTPANFSLGGDSGSIIFDYDSNKIVGLLHCGNGYLNSFANKIEPLFNKLEISL